MASVNRGSDPLPGACFALEQRRQEVTRACDGDDGQDDGLTTFDELEPGSYLVIDIHPPADLNPAKDRKANVRADRTTKLTMKYR